MKIKHVILETTDRFEIGKSYEVSDDGKEHFLTDFTRMTTDLWFVQSPFDILQTIGVTCTDKKRAESMANMFDGNINGFYYMNEANVPGSEEPLKWLLGALAAHMNEENIPFGKINSVLPADYLRAFCSYLEQKKFARTFAKEVFAELLKSEQFEQEGFEKTRSRRLTGEELMDSIISDPRFKAADDSEIDQIITDVLSNNTSQAEKAKTDPRVIQFLVGQVMKASKGKASAPVVQEKLRALLA